MKEELGKELRVPFGRRNGVLVAPADVEETGLACACTCPGCGADLIIRQGKKRRHFAHYRAVGSAHCVESAIHGAAIQVLLESNWLQVPEKFVSAGMMTEAGYRHAKFKVVKPARKIRFDSCRREQTFYGPNGRTIRADVVGFRAERQMLVEMCFTHAVDEKKLETIRAIGLPAIEINLFDLDLDAGFDGVRQRVLEDTVFKEWLFHPGEDEALAKLQTELEDEVTAINAAHRAKQAKEEAQRQAREARQEARRHEVQAVLERYRALPVQEKEQRLREQLGITGSWPRHLQVLNAKNDAIAAAPRIWQASVFNRFIFKKPLEDYTFTLHQALHWVLDRFGSRPGTNLSASSAVQSFLSYLKGCGYLERHYNPYGSDYYRIRYNGLMPPPRTIGKETARFTSSLAAPSPIAVLSLDWLPVWPEYNAAMKVATSRPYGGDACVTILTILYRAHLRPESPNALARELAARGVPAQVTLAFLLDAGFARQTC